jgi:RNA polymerase-binding protein DksA
MSSKAPSRVGNARGRVSSKTTAHRASARRAKPTKTAPSRTTNGRAARPVRIVAKTGRASAPVKGGSKAAAGRALSKKELAEFRRVLESERERLTEELEAIEEHLPEVEQVSMDTTGGYDEDLADVASDAFEREKGFAIENSVQDLLNQVEEALSRIDEGTYGLCEVCRQPIHPERLRALSYARLCIDCKSREEQTTSR